MNVIFHNGNIFIMTKLEKRETYILLRCVSKLCIIFCFFDPSSLGLSLETELMQHGLNRSSINRRHLYSGITCGREIVTKHYLWVTHVNRHRTPYRGICQLKYINGRMVSWRQSRHGCIGLLQNGGQCFYGEICKISLVLQFFTTNTERHIIIALNSHSSENFGIHWTGHWAM